MKNNSDLKNILISGTLIADMAILSSKLLDCPDLVIKFVHLGEQKEGAFVFLKNTVDTDLLQRDMIQPILQMDFDEILKKDNLTKLPASDQKFLDTIDAIVEALFLGNAVFMMEDMNFALSCSISKSINRSNEEPPTEKNVKGAHAGFIESVDANISMLRSNIINQNLKFKMTKVGAVSNQKIAIAYIDGIANMELVQRMYDKINAINTDGIVVIGMVEQYISDFPYTPFPEFLTTERPDQAMASLLEGRLLVLLDGCPVTIIAPVSFFSFFKTADDYSFDWMFGSFMGIIRIFSTFIALFLPAIYISILTFHYEMIPLDLLIPLAESRVKVPFTPIIEALMMEVVIEILREAAVRLPTYVGASIGVVGGIVIGQAAVEAGIVSNLMVIVVAVTAIASFSIPSYNMSTAIRVLRFIIMIIAAVFGMIGIIICAVFLLANLLVMESLGQPYFQPLIPFKAKDMKDFIIRFPIKYHKQRPNISKPEDKTRGINNE